MHVCTVYYSAVGLAFDSVAYEYAHVMLCNKTATPAIVVVHMILLSLSRLIAATYDVSGGTTPLVIILSDQSDLLVLTYPSPLPWSPCN